MNRSGLDEVTRATELSKSHKIYILYQVGQPHSTVTEVTYSRNKGKYISSFVRLNVNTDYEKSLALVGNRTTTLVIQPIVSIPTTPLRVFFYNYQNK